MPVDKEAQRKESGSLTICMIVKNEAALLLRCLQSIRSVADEIVVVDTGSTDATIDIAEQCGARVVKTQWKDDFSEARNVSLRHATGSWILWLDADDLVPAHSLPLIDTLKKQVADRVLGFTIRNERPGNTGTEFIQARMFPNRKDIFFERAIHEQMMPSALRLGLRMVTHADVVIEHHGYADPQTLKKKAGRNVKLLLQEYQRSGPDTVMAVEIADSYQLMEEYVEAQRWYRAVLSIPRCSEETPTLAGHAWVGLGTISNRSGEYGTAIESYKQALALSPWRSDVLYNMAVALELLGEPHQALSCLEQVLTIEPRPGQVGVDFRAARLKSLLRMTRLLAELNRMEDAERVCNEMIAAYPGRPEVFLMAGKYLLKAGKLMDALHAFEKSLEAFREGNIEAYIGLCIIYRLAGMEQRVLEALHSLEPLYHRDTKYLAFRKFFLNESDGIAADQYETSLEALRRGFLRVF